MAGRAKTMPHAKPLVLGVALVAVGLLVSACGNAAPTSSTAAPRDLPQPAAPARHDAAASSPTWLPAGAAEAGSATVGLSAVTYFSLPGRANDTVLPPGKSLAEALAAHPPTQIAFRSGPAGSLTSPVDDPVLYVTKSATVAGSPATLVEQANGLGGVTLSWRASRTEFQLSTERLATVDGESGVGDDVLVKMADSVR
jgi:hypothetical protein